MFALRCCCDSVAFDTFDVDGNGSIGVVRHAFKDQQHQRARHCSHPHHARHLLTLTSPAPLCPILSVSFQRELSDFIGKLDSKTGDIPKTVKRVLTMFDSNADQSIGLDEFAEMNLKYPHLLWPAFRLQYRIQEMTIGLNQWKGAIKRCKQKKELEEGRVTARTGCFGCFGGKPQPHMGGRNGSRSQSKSTESGATTPSGRHSEGRKLNADRIKRRQSGAASKKLSVMKGRSRHNLSQSIHSSNERSLTSHTSHTQHTRTTTATGHRRTITATSTNSTHHHNNKSLRRNTTHATVTRGVHSRDESEVVAGRMGWASQSIAEEKVDRLHAPRGSVLTAAASQEVIEDADTSAQSDDDGDSPEQPARVIPKKGPNNRSNTFFPHKSSSVHPLDVGGGGERGAVVSRRSSAATAVLTRGPSASPNKGSPPMASPSSMRLGSLSGDTPLSPGKAHLTRG